MIAQRILTGRLPSIVLAALVASTLPIPSSARFEPTPSEPTPADTEDADAEAKALGAAGSEAFRAGEFDRAIAAFEEAYARVPMPNLIFNIGRAYEAKGELSRALERYEAFVLQPGVDLDTRALAANRMKVIRSILAEVGPGEEVTAREDHDAPLAPVEPALAGTGEERPRNEPNRALRISGLAAVGLGAAALLTGAVVGGVARQRASRADREQFIVDSDRDRTQARRLAVSADALFITGGIVAVTGLVLVAIGYGRRAGSKRGDVALRPSLRRGQGGLIVEGSF